MFLSCLLSWKEYRLCRLWQQHKMAWCVSNAIVTSSNRSRNPICMLFMGRLTKEGCLQLDHMLHKCIHVILITSYSLNYLIKFLDSFSSFEWGISNPLLALAISSWFFSWVPSWTSSSWMVGSSCCLTLLGISLKEYRWIGGRIKFSPLVRKILALLPL